MTTIASNVALTLLAQPSPLLAAPLLASSSAGGDARSAADTILAIVSAAASAGEKPADAAPAPTARAVGGTVSSELSKPQLSAMAAAGSMVTTYDPIAAANGFTPIKASVENAEAFIRGTSYGIDDYNRGLEPDEQAPTREEYFAQYAAWGAKRLADGEDPVMVKRDLDYFATEEQFQSAREWVEVRNSSRHKLAELGHDLLVAGQERIAEVFGVKLPISFDEHGRASIGSFELRYGNGNLMLQYDPKAGLKTYHEDGTLRSSYAKDKVSYL
ncbi:hypothetical protein [Rhizobium sp. CC-YZS058]|uniref:hypothetical protein n=1 Tax=Rhizobium sp. CC-YZS058 TaxID=3042153 RepID=UPI002B062242|nr:hypothetical protein [Rhizobium sp. CC-YZS058]MEA3534492.1 hypothetical protein [Rhizobium sp. CC-YZS058]